ncbi:SDR family oxidoreductase [Bauldia litoralis]|uniref:NAD(P)-dependent dehydrogenase, short-chain alcohol dehydrogenase family n=1 Tax=Bauldia litoralis TaxID=665467 RepID=A0A1G6CC00_9HYPH|nr:SDR family oxidoreductase [Bauldia litoralis]SDB30416.1 NAD(P)-dependent dehydrogenase, short-chain alcohol dehydrogenase family [Bauldia litoralis]
MTTTNLKKQFAGKVAVVTGGTQGLGETVARLLAARGAAGIVICGRNAKLGKAVAASLGKTAAKVVFIKADLNKVEDCRKVIAGADKAFGRVDVVVNVAATTDRGTILDTSPELFDRMFALNVRAPFFLIQDAAKIMRREGIEGSIVNIQSMSAHGGQPFITAYSASKAALSALTKNAAFSLMPDCIRVNGLNIGWMDTPGEHSIQMRYHTDDKDWLAKAEQSQPFGRLLKPEEVARAVAYLASDESGMMTGSIIDFDQQVLGSAESAAHPTGRLPDA